MSTTTTKPAAKKAAVKKPAAKAAAHKKAATNGATKPAPVQPPTVLIGLPEGKHEWIDPGLIDPHPHNRTVEPKTCIGLASSMKGRRQIQAACVRPHPTKPNRFQLGAGCRRWHGAKINGEKLLCRVVDMSDAQIESMLAIENLQREAPDPRQEAEQIRRMAQLPNTSAAEIAAALGKDDKWVQRRMKLTALCDELHAEWLDPKSEIHALPVAAMELLASIPHDVQMAFLKEVEDSYDPIATAKDVADWISHQSCDLKGADFLDNPATFIPGCGPGCANSSAACGLLAFDEFASSQSKEGHCLNESCFNKRLQLARAHNWEKAIATDSKNGFVAITNVYPCKNIELKDGRSIKLQESHQFWNWKDAKKDMPGAVLFLVESREGNITRSFKIAPKDAPNKAKLLDADGTAAGSVRTAAQTMKASIDRVQGKRYTELLERLVKHVKGLPKTFLLEGLKVNLLPLVVHFGTNERSTYAEDEKHWKEALAMSEGMARTKLWESIQKVMLQRLADRSCTDRKSDLIAPKFQAEMRNVAEITGFKFDDEYAAIAKSMKLPATLKDLDVVTLKKKGKEAA